VDTVPAVVDSGGKWFTLAWAVMWLTSQFTKHNRSGFSLFAPVFKRFKALTLL